jgi:thiamine biosynthesis lipoprotein
MNGGKSAAGQFVHRFEHRAMATVFEVMIADEDRKFAEGAAYAVFQEIDRLEQELSRFLPNSDIARINNLPANGSVRIGLNAFQCLQLSARYWRETKGAFDVTLGVLVDCWVGKDKSLLHPTPLELAHARNRTGMNLLEFDESTLSVCVHEPVPRVDLGAIGKGYAVDRAADLLKEWGITSALVHGGASSAYAFGDHPKCLGWPVTLSNPQNPYEVLEEVFLNAKALGGSGIKKGKHIIDPRTGHPARTRRAAWVCSDSATESDAVSTACMIMTTEEIERYVAAQPDVWAMIVEEGREGRADTVLRFGVGSSA